MFGKLKNSTSVKQVCCEADVQLLPPLSDRQMKSSTAAAQQGIQYPLVEPLFQLQISETKLINHYEVWVLKGTEFFFLNGLPVLLKNK